MRIFDIEEGRIKINENCLLIPELKAIIDEYEDSIPALSFVYFMTDPSSPYNNLPDEEKKESISFDVKGDFGLDDEVIEAAIVKCAKLYETPTMRYYNAIKQTLDMVSDQLSNTTTITYGKDGNAEIIDRMQTNAGKKIEAFKKLEKIKDEEVRTLLRGRAELGMY